MNQLALPEVRKERMVAGDTVTSPIRGQLRLVVLDLAAHLGHVENLEQMCQLQTSRTLDQLTQNIGV